MPYDVQELRDILKELERVLALHFSDDKETIRRCCYSADGEAPTVSDGIWGEEVAFF